MVFYSILKVALCWFFLFSKMSIFDVYFSFMIFDLVLQKNTLFALEVSEKYMK